LIRNIQQISDAYAIANNPIFAAMGGDGTDSSLDASPAAFSHSRLLAMRLKLPDHQLQIAMIMVVALILSFVLVMVAGFLAFRTRRGGWAGVFLGVFTTVSVWIALGDVGKSAEIFSLYAGAIVAGVAACGLPVIDRLVAAFLASTLAYLTIWVIPAGGADNPLPILVAPALAGFAVGAFIALVATGCSSVCRSLIMR
jgi:hypothetical protein